MLETCYPWGNVPCVGIDPSKLTPRQSATIGTGAKSCRLLVYPARAVIIIRISTNQIIMVAQTTRRTLLFGAILALRCVATGGEEATCPELAAKAEDVVFVEDVFGAEEDGLDLLVVGGVDGSGTRGVVALLERLGVPFVYDDHVSLDVHGAEMGGWPAVVQPLLEAARLGTPGRSCDAPPPFPPKPTDLPLAVSSAATSALSHLIRASAVKRRLLPPATSTRGPESLPTLGIKAPVSMAVVPSLLALRELRRLRFLLVSRDGRDISFSANQSPVTKFFNATFGEQCWGGPWGVHSTTSAGLDDGASSYLRAAKLWSAWNSGLLEWGSKCSAVSAAVAGGGAADEAPARALRPPPRFSFHTLRVEDLVAGDDGATFSVAGDSLTSRSAGMCSQYREAAIAKLAAFVGSPVLLPELCCACAEPPPFLGASVDLVFNGEPIADSLAATTSSTGGSSLAASQSGYGKWQSRVANSPALASALGEVAGPTLAAFGYLSSEAHVANNRPVRGTENSGLPELLRTDPNHGSSAAQQQCTSADDGPRGVVGEALCARSLMDVVRRGDGGGHRWSDGGCEYLSGFSVLASRGAGAAQGHNGAIVRVADAAECCSACRGDGRCRNFAFAASVHTCFLMGSPEGFMRDASVISGWPVARKPGGEQPREQK